MYDNIAEARRFCSGGSVGDRKRLLALLSIPGSMPVMTWSS
jgi:hypothetical protein